ncbi:Crp/Fnr family transcriptional regulator [Pelagibius sp.]|uniref:Crp/Fnr family transcriptional regulator n=1 Tax=Pelagibius sp. TaxID=1931238 RepID=UPI003B50390B
MEFPEHRDMDLTMLTSMGVEVLRFDAGQHIIEQGSSGTDMFVLRSGRAAIAINGATIEEIGPGGFFGEMGLVDGSPRSATVVALEPCEVVPVGERSFLFLVHETPYFALDVMRTMAARVRRMNEKLLTV